MATSTSFAVPGDFETENNGGLRFRPPVVDQMGPSPPSPPTSPQRQQGENINVKTCRICLDTTTSAWDPELGRLLSPCRCRGSSKYVHEECLNSWRRISANAKSYYECNTCGYRYKFRRLAISRWVGSRALQFSLTALILTITIYILGFIADPIINTYIGYPSLPNPTPQFGPQDNPLSDKIPKPEPGGITEHMLKGLTSLGLLGFLKVIFFLGPNSWWNLRNSGLLGSGGGRAGATGRERLGQLGWVVVLVGVLNFFVWVWKKVSMWTRGWLDKAVEEIMDVPDEEVERNR